MQFHASVDLLTIAPHGAPHAVESRCCRCSEIHLPEPNDKSFRSGKMFAVEELPGLLQAAKLV